MSNTHKITLFTYQNDLKSLLKQFSVLHERNSIQKLCKLGEYFFSNFLRRKAAATTIEEEHVKESLSMAVLFLFT